MAIRIQPSRQPSGEVAEFDNKGIAATQTFLRGTPLTLSSGLAAEHAGGTTVTDLYGFATEDVTSSASDGPNSTQVNIAVANPETVFLGQLYNSGVVAPDIANVGVQYGLVEASNEWFVDETDTTNVMVTVVDFDLDIDVGVVFFKVIPSAIYGA